MYLGACAICSMGRIIMTLEFALKRRIREGEGSPGRGGVCAKAQEVIRHSSREERGDCGGGSQNTESLTGHVNEFEL